MLNGSGVIVLISVSNYIYTGDYYIVVSDRRIGIDLVELVDFCPSVRGMAVT